MLWTTRSAVFVRGVMFSVAREVTADPRPRRSPLVTCLKPGHCNAVQRAIGPTIIVCARSHQQVACARVLRYRSAQAPGCRCERGRTTMGRAIWRSDALEAAKTGDGVELVERVSLLRRERDGDPRPGRPAHQSRTRRGGV